MSPRAQKTIGYFEIIIAVAFAFISVVSYKTAFFPSENIHWESPGWAFFIFLVFTPLCLSTGLAGIAMLRNFRFKWHCHALMIGIILGNFLFFWYADRA